MPRSARIAPKEFVYHVPTRGNNKHYLDNGLLKPDNNTAENAMRPVALGRKNWLFVGSERGGHAAALYMSLIQSCKNCDVNPWEYLNDMLRRIMGHPVNRLRELLPDQWKSQTR